jgi:hypothetical protein
VKWILAGALSAAMLGGSGTALAQPYVYYPPPVYHYGFYPDYDVRYYDSWRHDNGRHRGWYKQRRHRYRHYYGYYPYRDYAPVRVCAWRFGERVCWWTR